MELTPVIANEFTNGSIAGKILLCAGRRGRRQKETSRDLPERIHPFS